MRNISKTSIFYKLYLYYNLYFRNKALSKRKSYSQNQEDLFIADYFKYKYKGFFNFKNYIPKIIAKFN